MNFLTSNNKLVSRERAAMQVSEWREQGLQVGFTSGVFDLLHVGHLSYLEDARKHCDKLVVAVNSDSSVRQNKGHLRPIVSEVERAKLIAGWTCVDLVFIFSENNNNQNVIEVKPSLYIKAGDYAKKSLSSASIIESQGGRVELVPFVSGNSSSTIIEKIIESHAAILPQWIELPKPELAPAVFLDRDGTLIEHVDYLSEPDRVKLLPGVIDGLKKLRQLGYRLVIVTNQPGIGLGYLSREEFFKVNLRLFKLVSEQGVLFDRVYFCPHSKSEICSCRKPGVELINRATKDLNISVKDSFVIGDTTTDMQLALNSECKGVLVKTGYAGKDGVYNAQADFEAHDFESAAQRIAMFKK
jgi:rfaE bifunctional protein nucleotidyltransferase chain/domain